MERQAHMTPGGKRRKAREFGGVAFAVDNGTRLVAPLGWPNDKNPQVYFTRAAAGRRARHEPEKHVRVVPVEWTVREILPATRRKKKGKK